MKSNIKDNTPNLDICSCSNCHWWGYVSECDYDIEHDPFEFSGISYEVFYCPNCFNDDILDNFCNSTFLIRLHLNIIILIEKVLNKLNLSR